MKKSFRKKCLILGLTISLSIPTMAMGKESVSGLSSTNQSMDLIEETEAFAVSKSINLLGIPRFVTKEQSKSVNKGLNIAKDKQNDRFVHNAVQFVTAMEAGKYGQALKFSSHALKKSISEQWLEIYWNTVLQQLHPQLGAFTGIGGAEVIESNKVHTNVEVVLQFERGAYPFTIRVDKTGKINDFLLNSFFGPSAAEPAYSNPDLFTEKEVVIGKGEFALPGILSIPKGKGTFPVVVLVQGSGASDKDETAYALKPFRDLAHGLASNGIAVLRYNKRTFEHSVKTTADQYHTVDKETTNDALLATRLLEKEKKIDDDQIYILGHSQGGMMVPQMINQDKRDNIAGAIVMGGPARTIQDVILDQFDYLLSIGQLTPQDAAFFKEQFAMLNDPNFSGENPPAEFQLGHSVFWDSINDIKAAEMAKRQNDPLLIIQGERDYQVVSDVEIPIWKKELSDRTNVEYRLYPKLNHFFTEGEGEMSTPMEYFTPANIPEYVVNDIAAWVKSKPD
ncbi:alpha/beta fold hydrolase [uncultured Metabacillus sp.]|uniref:alpha/beta hydrolase n=1 Tax=uncultured Metabacillus sp. TaxID=2860135 RepID=UPI0026281DE0|nr:alpha/beta fold hydrolase [uncultured Metabacillus sp.]